MANISKNIKRLRTSRRLTQEQLAGQLNVRRQTISSWENDKSYPDIHSLLMLGEVFDVSLDTLVKGDIEIMKEKVSKENIRSFNRDSWIYATLLIVCAVSVIPLFKWGGVPGIVVWGLLFAAALFFAVRLEKVKKEQDVHTYREIVAFTNGEKLDGSEKAREEGKRRYQLVAVALLCAAAGWLIAWIVSLIL